MYFDNAFNHKGYEVDILLVSSPRSLLSTATKLDFRMENNMTQYEVWIIWIQAGQNLQIKASNVYRTEA